MKNSGAIALFTCLILATVWWNWPDWGRREYWFPRDQRIATIAGCLRGQLTTMRPHDGGSLSAVALNNLAALAIFEEPLGLSESPAALSNLQGGIVDDISKEVDRFFALVEQGEVVRVPEKKLVRYLRPSEFAHWIVEVEVFQRGDKRLHGFAYRMDLDCWKFE